ncbi:MAG: signal recognition particle protein Srp54 [Candidatus Bathyarchaeia archaeon]
MTLEKVGSTLNESLRRILRLPLVDEAAVKELVKDLQRALLQADVNVQMVLDLSKEVENRALHEKLPPGVSRREHVVKVLYEELTKLLGEKPSRLAVQAGRVSTLMLVGIQGSGKTTGAVKIARFLKKRGVKAAVVCADTYRPGALAQLKQLADTAGIPVYGEESGMEPVKIAKNGVDAFRRAGYEAIIVDTAGRHRDDASLIEEMKEMAAVVKPDQIILVIDGTIGQQAAVQARGFHEATEIGAIYVTKLDGAAKGGGALSAVAATGAPILFIGTGEKVEDIELFDPPRFVGRLLGMGDIQGLVEKFKEAEVKIAEDKAKAILSGKFTLTDMYEQIENLRKLGPLGKVLRMMPGGAGQIPDSMVNLTEEKIDSFRVIIQSMTKAERENPKIVNPSRVRRISRGSGRSEREVKELIQQYEMSKKMLKTLMRQRKPFKMFEKMLRG